MLTNSELMDKGRLEVIHLLEDSKATVTVFVPVNAGLENYKVRNETLIYAIISFKDVFLLNNNPLFPGAAEIP